MSFFRFQGGRRIREPAPRRQAHSATGGLGFGSAVARGGRGEAACQLASQPTDFEGSILGCVNQLIDDIDSIIEYGEM